MDDKKTYITVQELCQRWSVSEQMLANWRTRGEGPSWTRLGRKMIRYDLTDILAFERSGQRAA